VHVVTTSTAPGGDEISSVRARAYSIFVMLDGVSHYANGEVRFEVVDAECPPTI